MVVFIPMGFDLVAAAAFDPVLENQPAILLGFIQVWSSTARKLEHNERTRRALIILQDGPSAVFWKGKTMEWSMLLVAHLSVCGLSEEAAELATQGRPSHHCLASLPFDTYPPKVCPRHAAEGGEHILKMRPVVDWQRKERGPQWRPRMSTLRGTRVWVEHTADCTCGAVLRDLVVRARRGNNVLSGHCAEGGAGAELDMGSAGRGG